MEVPVRSSFVGLILGTMLTVGAARATDEPSREVRGYQAVLEGAKPLATLTREEVWELIRRDRNRRERYLDRRSSRERCLEAELSRLQGPPTQLALRTIDLKCSQR
jgi:hypothetical protein